MDKALKWIAILLVGHARWRTDNELRSCLAGSHASLGMGCRHALQEQELDEQANQQPC